MGSCRHPDNAGLANGFIGGRVLKPLAESLAFSGSGKKQQIGHAGMGKIWGRLNSVSDIGLTKDCRHNSAYLNFKNIAR